MSLQSKKLLSHFFSIFGIELPSHISRSSIKRQSEYLAGRFAAYTALKSLGENLKTLNVDENFAPRWEKGIHGSISHNNTIALCVISLEPEHKYVGVDIEEIITTDVCQEIKNKIIFYKTEYKIVKESTQPEKAFTIIFSSKESLFKAIYPYIQTKKIGFETSNAKKIEDNCLHLELNLPQSKSNLIHLNSIRSHYWKYGNNVSINLK